LYFSNFADWEGQIKVEEWVKLAHESQIPAFIDAAADTPPVSLVAFSGGKAFREPQCQVCWSARRSGRLCL